MQLRIGKLFMCCTKQWNSSNSNSVNFLQVSKMSGSPTISTTSETSDTPMEVVILEEDNTIKEEETLHKKPEGSRKDLGKT